MVSSVNIAASAPHGLVGGQRVIITHVGEATAIGVERQPAAQGSVALGRDGWSGARLTKRSATLFRLTYASAPVVLMKI